MTAAKPRQPSKKWAGPVRPFDSDDHCKEGDSRMKRPMAKKTAKYRSWTKEDIRTLKTMVREKTKTSVVARKLKRTPAATRQKAAALGVKLAGVSQRRKKA
jgi:hypothetical protein